MKELDKAFESYKPEIAKRFSKNVRRVYTDIVDALGEEMKGVHSHWTWTKPYNNVVRPFVRQEEIEKYKRYKIIIDEAKLAAGANTYADAVIAKWRAKIEEKVGSLENAEVQHLDGMRFRISGMKGVRKVVIEQDMIINSRGHTLFNQFPARIYVNGEFISERGYKTLIK